MDSRVAAQGARSLNDGSLSAATVTPKSRHRECKSIPDGMCTSASRRNKASLAILLVLSLHVGEFFPPRIQNLPFVFYGCSGVDLFFVLSGC